MDILRRALAPIADEAWEEIDETAKQVFKAELTAREFVQIDGPKGWDYPAVPTGRLDVKIDQQSENIRFGIHQVQPLIEPRISFELDKWELDNVARGAKDIDLEPLEKAAQTMAQFEERVIYEGLEAAQIKGLDNSSDYDICELPKEPEKMLLTILDGIEAFKQKAVGGPYTLVATNDVWKKLSGFVQGYSLKKQLNGLLGGSIIHAPNNKQSYLISERGDDLNMTVGQDLAIGYESSNADKVKLFFTETFTFQVLDPAVVLVLK